MKEKFGLLLLALMIAFALNLSTGCAGARFDPETGRASSWAIGQSTAVASADGTSVEGGALSDGLVGFLTGVAQTIGQLLPGGAPAPEVTINLPAPAE
jgi:hypothetical protein